MAQASSYQFFEEARTHPIIALVNDINSKIPEIHAGADFMLGRVVWKDSGTGKEIEAIETTLNFNLLPAIAIYEETSRRVRVGIGEYIDEKGKIKATQFISILTFDIWGLDSYQRELASGIITNYVTTQMNLRQLGFIDFRELTTRSRGFDLTDRILQFHSHQITVIWRRMLHFFAQYEVIVPTKKFVGLPVTKFIINAQIDDMTEHLLIGDEVIPYPIWDRMQRSW